MTYLAIDPGIDTGWAVFSDADHLVACGLGNPLEHVTKRGDEHITGMLYIDTAVIERPKIYNARNMKGNPNDIITLALGAGEYAGVLKSWRVKVGYITPHEWKGNTPKAVDNARTIARLSEVERAIVKRAAFHIATSKQNNVLDAIGLGRAAFDLRLWP